MWYFQSFLTACSERVSRSSRVDFDLTLMGPFSVDPLAATSHTPLYSNAGYQILGYALEAIAKADYEDILIDRLIKPLNLTRSGLQPHPQFGVILSNETYSWFNYTVGDENP
jgi:CubicO group peptidase (beta-lactamase class C family)